MLYQTMTLKYLLGVEHQHIGITGEAVVSLEADATILVHIYVVDEDRAILVACLRWSQAFQNLLPAGPAVLDEPFASSDGRRIDGTNGVTPDN